MLTLHSVNHGCGCCNCRCNDCHDGCTDKEFQWICCYNFQYNFVVTILRRAGAKMRPGGGRGSSQKKQGGYGRNRGGSSGHGSTVADIHHYRQNGKLTLEDISTYCLDLQTYNKTGSHIIIVISMVIFGLNRQNCTQLYYRYISHRSKTAKMKSLWCYDITNHMRQLA